ncbi:MAG: hypothetical protein GXO78_07755 [Calditrichaeota bacterium]|nr:hypothetical protein [Calditrichota bacterium]
MKVLALANYLGEDRVLGDLKKLVEREKVDFIVFAGGIVKGLERVREFEDAEKEGRAASFEKVSHEEESDLKQYELFFKGLGELNTPVFYIPGKFDAPIDRYLREAFNYEIVYPHIRNIHKSFSFYRNHYELVGFGGEISEKTREEKFILRYPRWEVEYHLKIIRDLRPMELIMVFYTPPYGGKLDVKDGKHTGSEVVEDFIKTYDPTFAFVGSGTEQGEEIIGTTHVINPGSLREGQYALLNLRRREIMFKTL